ncbi:hypothetical protein [Streptomyces chattanoogensis]|uniref:hypothetical protein n=1 Tax=Streptomyces chattanoogensis TaxID=66876 RepID=UPI0006B4721F|nr:hypothetical protein [Streptomyces chattanoogensis]
MAMWALGMTFMMLPAFGIVCLTCSAACRAQRNRAVKILGHALPVPGPAGVLTPVAMMLWLFW